MATEDAQQTEMAGEEEQSLNKRMEGIAWGLFLIMIGGLWLVPGEVVPEGTWLIGLGLIFLGLNAARYAYQIKVSWFTIVLGVIALVSGLGDFLGMDLPVVAILLVLLGAYILVKGFARRG